MVVNEEHADQFIAAMLHLAKAIKSESDRCCKISGGFNEKELSVIAFVGQQESATMGDIAGSLSAPLSTLTSIVDKLVINKFLLRYNSGDDRRVVCVALAEKGKESYKIFLAQKQDVARKVLGQFNETHQSALVSYLRRLTHAIEEAN